MIIRILGALAVVAILIFLGVSMSTSSKNINKINTSKSDINTDGEIKFKFNNLSPVDIEVYVEWDKTSDLELIANIPAKSTATYVPTDKRFVPGIHLFSKMRGDPMGTFIFKPIELMGMHYNINFGEVSTDTMKSKVEYSEDPNEIRSLYIENRSLKPYDVWYASMPNTPAVHLGRIDPYHPAKQSVKYSLNTNNFEKHFQVGTKLMFKMITIPTNDSSGPKSDNWESITLDRPSITDVYLGDVVGRDEFQL